MSLLTCPPELWIAQARSDREAGDKLRRARKPQLRCHAVAKYQQAVEKCIKAMALALEQAGVAQVPLNGFYNHDVSKLTRAFQFSPATAQEINLLALVKNALDPNRGTQAEALCRLAPRKPKAGQLHDRNTEYPYETAPGAWVAPADPQSFTPADVSDADEIAGIIYRNARKIVSAAARMP